MAMENGKLKKHSVGDFKDFRIEIIQADEYKMFIPMLLDHFLNNEPLILGSHIAPKDFEKVIIRSLKKWCAAGVSLKATYIPSNELAAFRFCEIVGKVNLSKDFVPLNANEHSEEANNLASVVHHLENAHDVFADPNIQKVWKMVALCVKQEFQGRGLGYHITKASENLAEKNGFKIAMAILTNKITQHMYQKMGYTVMYRMDFKEFKVNGKPAIDLSTTRGTTEAQVVIKYLNGSTTFSKIKSTL